MINNKLKLIICIVMLLSVLFNVSIVLTGCNNNNEINEKETTINSGFDKSKLEGYSQTMFTYVEGIMYIEYVSENREDFLLVKCKMSEKEADEFFDIEYNDENYEEPYLTYLSKFDSVSIESLKDKMPDKDLMNRYIGKTITDLVADGYEQIGACNGEDDYIYFEYGNDKYTFRVLTVQKFESLLDMEDIDLNTLEIEEISFYDFVNLDFE